MFEKICSNCGTTLLVGLQYCPGCLRAIDRGYEGTVESFESNTPTDAADDGSVGSDSFFLDMERIWDNLIFPLKCFYCRLVHQREPLNPAPVPSAYRPKNTRYGPRDAKAHPTLVLTPGYTRVVCPKCLSAQRASLDLSPSEVVTCRSCMHPFPGSFAAEFRKGADLECFRCGVTTFCVSGLKVTTCPNCRFGSQNVVAKTKIKAKFLAAVAVSVFLGFFAHAIITQTTTHFIVGTCVAIVGSFLGFVTLVALGF